MAWDSETCKEFIIAVSRAEAAGPAIHRAAEKLASNFSYRLMAL